MGFISDVRKQKDKAKMWEELDERLLNAAFDPAIKEEFVYDDIIYKSPHDFLASINSLSEFYMTINPVLSSGLWSTWNSLVYMSRGRIKRIKDKELMSHYKALVATAVLQFADGDANRYARLGNAEKENIEKYVAKAIADLEKLPNWNDAYE